VENRGIAVAIWGIAISIGYAICPHMPQYALCMALYVVVFDDGHAANGR
jgi:sugar phosphate permease